MRCKAYIGIYGDESTIKSFGKDANIDGATIRCHDKVTEAVSITGKPSPWSFSTGRITLETDDIDAEIKTILNTHKELIPIIKRYVKNADLCVSVVVIMQYDEDESPRGIFLSSDTISILNDINADFEVDAVQLMQ